MAEILELAASALPQPIPGTGIAITAPGLTGRLTYATATEQTGLRATEIRHLTPIDRALAETALDAPHLIQLDAPTPREPTPGAVRGPGGLRDDEVLLDLAGPAGPVLFAIYQDEAGVISLHGPDPAHDAGPAVRAAGVSRRIKIRLRRPEPPATEGPLRGFGANLAGKVIKLVVRQVVGAALELGEYRLVKYWENTQRAHQGFHHGMPDKLLAPVPLPAEESHLKQLAGRRSLLFLHGTTSSTAGAFGRMLEHPHVGPELWNRYGNRVIGFNHHTLSKNVATNVVDFFRELPVADRPYEFDVVVHSRGGLLARALTAAPDALIADLAGVRGWSRPADKQVRIHRVVFVGTPNNGTPLAHPANISGALDWMANVAEVFPGSTVAVALGAVFSIMSLIVETGLKALPGLVDQAADAGGPTGNLLRELNRDSAVYLTTTSCSGVSANYKITAPLLLGAAATFGLRQLFLDQDNDLVVPTHGVARLGTADFTATLKLFLPTEAAPVHHTCYFGHPDTWRHIEKSLPKTWP